MSCRSLILCLAFCFLFLPTISAQESDFATLKSKWIEVDKQLKEKDALIKSGDTASEAGFRDLIDQANSLIVELRSAGVDALKANPKNRDVIKTLMGIMINDAHFGRDKEVLQLGDALIDAGINPRYFEIAADSARLDISAREIFEELGIRLVESNVGDLQRVKLSSTQGEIVLELFENEAPNTVANFISLIESDFYTGLDFHRVKEDFMAQAGCPEGTGGGGPGYTISCDCYEPDARKHFTGSLSMAKMMPRDTGGSQFFLTFRRTDMLDGRHTVFGRIVSGWDVLDNIARTHEGDGPNETPIENVVKDKIEKIEVLRKRDHKYRPRKVGIPFEEDEEDEEPAEQPPSQPKATEGDDQESSDKGDDSTSESDKADDEDMKSEDDDSDKESEEGKTEESGDKKEDADKEGSEKEDDKPAEGGEESSEDDDKKESEEGGKESEEEGGEEAGGDDQDDDESDDDESEDDGDN